MKKSRFTEQPLTIAKNYLTRTEVEELRTKAQPSGIASTNFFIFKKLKLP
jgi:hypothetical protein